MVDSDAKDSKPVDEKPKDSDKKDEAEKEEEEEPWWKFSGKEWESKGSEKADRDFTFEKIWKTLLDPKANVSEKIGVAMLSLAQYFYRRK